MTVCVCRKASYERKLQQQLWQIDLDDLQFTDKKVVGSISTVCYPICILKISFSHVDTI